MDTITFSCLLPIAVLLPLSLFLFFIGSGRRTTGRSNYPPGSSGWPVVGENIEYALSGPVNFIKKRMNKFSPDVFQTSLMGEKMAIFCGPQGNKFIFMNENNGLTSWWPQSIKKILFFPGKDPLKEATTVARRFLHELIRPEALKQYIAIMDSLAREHLEKHWAPHSEVKVFPLSKVYTFTVACKLFMGIDDPQIIETLMKNFYVIANGILSVPIDFPGTAYNRAIKGGALVREELMKIITVRKTELMENKETVGKDFMSQLLLVTDEKGRFFSEMDVCNDIIGLLVASYETTSTAIAFVLKHLAEFPHIYEQVLAEQMEIAKSKAPGDLLNWDDLQKMEYSWNVARESMRVRPSSNGSFREAMADITYAGFTIPKGWKTFWTVYSTHMNPRYFPNPERFDPSRFDGCGPQAYTYVPFGGGARMCPGREYARVILLVFIHNVVNKFKLEKSIPDEKIVYYASPVPVNGLPVRLHPHRRE